MKTRSAGLLGVLVLVLVSAGTARAQTTVMTTSGTVQGVVVGAGATAVTKWLGVPYAEPPVGNLRWARPVAKSPSLVTIDATTPKAACLQTVPQIAGPACKDVPTQAAGSVVGSEDCLTLSVWRPTADPPSPALRPVMVWIHGGAFVQGCAKDTLGEATDLALHGVEGGQVVVAIQYRLGPMGFFALPELAAEDPNGSAGNQGMLDMVLALQWVQDNIEAFGGDPNNVTIFGESAGGVATCALLASPLASSLFERAITESGNCAQAIPLAAGPGATFPAGATAFDRGQTLAANPALACGTDPATRLACMRGKSPAEIFPVYNAETGGTLGFPPTNMSIDHYFLDEQPIAMLADGAAQGRSLLIGSNGNEMTGFTLFTSVPSAAAYEAMVRAAAGDYVADYLLQIWPANEFASPLEAWRRFAEDIGFVCPTFQAAKATTDAGSDAYVYHFVYDPGAFLNLRSFHGLELFYVFGNTAGLANLGVTLDAGDANLSEAMQVAWTSYARTGVPLAAPAWPVFDMGGTGLASAGSALVWNVAPSPDFSVANSVVTGGSAFRDGRCADLEAIGPLLNDDHDGLTNDVDNCISVTNSDQADHDLDGVGTACDSCPYTANPAQTDSVGNGIGDACRCGDANDDTQVGQGDVDLLRSALAQGVALTGNGAAKCSVAGGTAACDVLDVVVLARRLDGLEPQLAQDCAAARPPSS
jgi:para-nitrobenzyl esterase